MTMQLVIDIDGILTNETEGHDYALRTANNKGVEKICQEYEKGNLIILHTSRQSVDWLVTSEWLKEQAIPYHHLVMGKPPGAAYVDDKALPSVDLLHFVNIDIERLPCWNSKYFPVCPVNNYSLLEILRTQPLLSFITLSRLRIHYCSLANDIPDLTSEINLNGFVDNNIVSMYKEAFKKCNKTKG